MRVLRRNRSGLGPLGSGSLAPGVHAPGNLALGVRQPDVRRLSYALLVVACLAALFVPTGVGVAQSAAWNAAPVAVDGVEVVLQSNPVSCGPALIATLSAWAGRPIGEAAVLSRAAMGPDGVSLAEFVRLASLFGSPGVWYQVARRELGRLPTPFVAQLEVDGSGHFVAVLGVRQGMAVVADPAVGALVGPVATVLRGFSGRVFLLEAQS